MTLTHSFARGLAAAALALIAAGTAHAQASAPAAAAVAPAPAAGKVGVLWLGQSAFKITTPTGKVIVIDPYLTANPKTPEAYKKLEALGKVDLILVTHGHLDHYLDAPALAKLNNAPLWAPAGLSQSMQTLGVLPVAQANRMNKGGSIRPFGPAGVRITMTRAEHSSELVWRNPATDKDETHVGGEPCGFVIEFENGFKLWHLGDTGVFGDMKLLGEMLKPDLLLIPIGGGQFVMNPADAAYATRELIKPKMALPMHYGTNAALVGTPEEYSKALGNASVKVLAIKPGDALEF
ncbi:metal-dependent hydrolase [Rhizobacter sp. Root404]|uniref:metal-dependent hydrolase n=1 Tax=Rhizobacter sp. Root404 TaxID=1736528 RepID=UPI0006FFF53F|nr:metal-dependent hydrolase [Rhizobacter sp. Root404]KQW35630.1 hydrolase [Rhizobacter sp. Root404]